ncbi:hypothetical protein COCMIDRAFT_92109 [Bipolaris oryzae ATCC 44560]|uniref:Uncharacterized protein n=1 Tax=Bipolaris oryzae ATCC 44560 TaxID=930090 RepID=W6ZH16_COCMI|nr:uncharacterized protein COCMIDRAFT_92109 [Bipolaris oryzae ATCC 44560]EUC46704.1 hypothetical protein COCMIDRAFT_92109 [Bipolaris oryzae ATCC 44560]
MALRFRYHIFPVPFLALEHTKLEERLSSHSHLTTALGPIVFFLVAKTPLSKHHGQSVHTSSMVMPSPIPLAFASPLTTICRNDLHRIASATSHPCDLVSLVSRRIRRLLITCILDLSFFYISLLFGLEPGLAQL